MKENHGQVSSLRERLGLYLLSLRKLTRAAWWAEHRWKILGVFWFYSFALLAWSISRGWRVCLIFGDALISLAFVEIPRAK